MRPRLFYIFLLKRSIIVAKIDDCFDEACDVGNKSPAEQQVKDPLSGFVQIEFVYSETSQKDRKQDCDAAAFGGNCRGMVIRLPVLDIAP